ncbi:MAG: hypothetical protein PVI11_05075 [Candidatus Aminicenantes bacterium]|jgi:rubrerythrin
MPAKKTTKKTTKTAAKKPAKKTAKTAPKKAARKPAKSAAKKPVKKPAKKKAAAKLKKGQAYECRVCGVGVVVDEVCGCVEEHTFICCMQPMKKTRRAKAA